MRRILLLALIVCGVCAEAQPLTESQRVLAYIQRVMNYNRAIPQEKVYLHFDNTGYFENETVWFKAYVTRTDKQTPTDLSKVLYVELLNPSGDVIKTQKYPIDEHGQARGDMKLDTLFGSGFYEVRAYTRYMTNWGVNAVFSRVFPVFKAPAMGGDYSDLSIKTRLFKQRDPNNRDRQDSLYLKAIDNGLYTNELAKTISVRFYPEGGNLTVGQEGRVALLAVSDNGRPYAGTGKVVNAAGETVATVRTDTLGRGTFTVTPDGSALTMRMENIGGKEQTFTLPAAKQEGCALTMDAVSDQILVSLRSSAALQGKLLGYAILNNGNIVHCDTMRAQPLIELELDRNRQSEGVNQLTVFDSFGRILAERLFFICPKPASGGIALTTPTARLKPCGPVEMKVRTQPGATFSFSAIDAQTMTNGTQGNMKTWMLLSSEVRGYIHNVDYYFEADDRAHRQSADLLMMTQGWRRYDWNVMAGLDAFARPQPIEDKFYVFGKLNEYRKRNPVGGVNLEAYLYNANGESLQGHTVTDKQGNYAFALPFLDGEWKMQIFTRKGEKRKTYLVGIDRQISPTPRFISPAEASITPPLKPNFFVRKPTTSAELDEEEFVPITQRNHLLQNVTVRSDRHYFTNDDWKYKNEAYGSAYATLYYDIDKELDDILDLGGKEPTLFSFLCQKNALFNNPEEKDLPSPPGDDDSLWTGHMSYAHRPIKWIVDNGETNLRMTYAGNYGKAIRRILGAVPEEAETLQGEMFAAITSDGGASGSDFFPIWMSDIRNLYIVPDHHREMDGAVRIYLYTRTQYTTESNKGLRRTYFQGFNTPSTFEMEDYSVLPPMADFRRTIFWDPDVKADADGRATIRFYNNSTCQEMYVTAEGMTAEGGILTGKP